MKFFTLILVLIFSQAGCSKLVDVSDYPVHTDSALEKFRRGDFRSAQEELKSGAETLGPDRLLFMLDRALILHTLGEYERSNLILKQAEKLLEPISYDKPVELRSINTPNLWRKFYHGEEYESILANVYLSLNYALLGRNEDSVHEIRRAEERLDRLRSQAKRGYTTAAFFRFWPGILYERIGNLSSANEDYLLSLPNSGEAEGLIKRSLLRLAARTNQISNELSLKNELGLTESALVEVRQSLRDQGEIVVLVANDFISLKAEHPDYPELAYFREPKLKYIKAAIFLDREEIGYTKKIFDVNALAQANFSAKLAQFQADKAAGNPTQAIKIERMAAQDPSHRAFRGHERVAKLSADLRQWATLPAEFQVLRFPARPGTHRIELRMEGADGRRGPFRDLGEVTISRPGEIKLLSFRSRLE
jgi:hypothetical protein